MTDRKRWPDHAEWARLDSIARQKTIADKCSKLLKISLPAPAKMLLMEMQLAAKETELALVRAKDPSANSGQE